PATAPSVGEAENGTADPVEDGPSTNTMARTLMRINATLDQLAGQESDLATSASESTVSDAGGDTDAANEDEEERSEPVDVRVVEESTLLDQLGYAATVIIAPIGMAALVIIFVLFMLLARDDLRDRLIKLTAGTRINLATQALDDAAGRISRYLRAQCIVNGTYG